MPALLIDDAGEVWPADPEAILSRFGGSRRPRDCVRQAVHLGFAYMKVCEAGAHIALRPHLISRLAMYELCDIVARQRPTRVTLSVDRNLSAWELIIGADRAIERIEELVAEARNPLPRPLLFDERLPLKRCLEIAEGSLLQVLQAWHQTQGRWEADLYGLLQECGLLACATITQLSRGSERLLIKHWGAKLAFYRQDWIRIAQGRDFEDQPNTELGRLGSTVQRQTIAERAPQLTRSDHVMRRIDGTLARLKFRRLCLPWQASDGAVAVTTITVERRMLILERPT